MNNESEIIIYNDTNGNLKIDVVLEDNEMWLSQKQMADLFERDTRTISEHISNIYKDKELDKSSSEHLSGNTGKIGRPAVLYNLDMIISVGYRVNSKKGIRFRKWATKILNSYLVKGYALNNKRLEQLGKVVDILKCSQNKLEKGQILQIIEQYHKALTLLSC
ncbi:MAG: virulence RhuM family protein [Coriobacteriales bacterium]|nr:virulence RhuM family protein [Coriobacteriales bacterium]